MENGGFEVKIGVFEVFLYGKWVFKGKTGFFWPILRVKM
jgi:hypothetical protein